MEKGKWLQEFPQAIKVCDADGVMVEMNDKAAKGAERLGGAALLGQNILNFHIPKALPKVESLLQEPQINCYTIEKNGVKSLIYQCPWYEDGKFMGYVELSLEIPFEMPHYVRTP